VRKTNSIMLGIAGATALTGTLAAAAWTGVVERRQQGGLRSKDEGEKAITVRTGFYCNLKAFTVEERARHAMESHRLKEARVEVKEIADGYAFRFDGEKISIAELGQWVAEERKCCPFFEMEIVAERDGGALWLRLRGSEGVKAFIRNEFGITAEHAAETNAMSRALDEWVGKTEAIVVPAAEAMPEEKYSFAPTNGEFAGVRTFAEQVKHLAAANYQLGARVLGEKPPRGEHGENAPDSVKAKAEIVEYLKGSFAYLHKAAASIDEKNAAVPIELPNGQSGTRVGWLVDALAHSQNHYGQMVEYLRMNGIVPPASR